MADSIQIGTGEIALVVDGREFMNELKNMQKAADQRFSAISKAAAGVLSIGALYKGVSLFGGWLSEGVRFNSQMEDSKLGLASIIATTAELADETGRITDFNKKWAASMVMAEDAQQQLRLAGLKTSLTYEELTQNLQVGLPLAMQAGAKSMGEIVQMTANVSQALRTMGIPMIQFRTEWAALVSGRIDPRSDLARMLFSGQPQESIKQQIMLWRRQGTVIEELNKKLAPFQKAGEEGAKNFSTAMSNMKDAATNFLGEAVKPLSRELGGWLNSLAQQLVTVNEKNELVWNPRFLGPARAIVQMIVDVTKATIEWVRQNAELLKNLASSVAIVTAVGVAIAVLVGIVETLMTPVGAAIAVIALLAVTWEKIRKWHDVEIAGLPIGKWFKLTFAGISTILKGWVNSTIAVFNVIWQTLKTVFTGLASYILAPMRVFSEAVLLFKDQLPEGVVRTATAMRDFSKNVQDSFTPIDNIKSAFDGISTAIGKNADLLQAADQKVGDILAGSSELPGAWDAVKGALKGINPLLDKIKNATSNVKILAQPTPPSPEQLKLTRDLEERIRKEHDLTKEIRNQIVAEAEMSPLRRNAIERMNLQRKAASDLAEELRKINREQEEQRAKGNEDPEHYAQLRSATRARIAAQLEKDLADNTRQRVEIQKGYEEEAARFNMDLANRSAQHMMSALESEKIAIQARYDFEIAQANRMADPEARAERIRQAELTLTQDLIEYDDKWFSKWNAGIRDMLLNATTMQQDITALTTRTVQQLEATWADGLFDALTGKIDDAREAFRAFFKDLLKQVIQFMVHRAVLQLLGMMGGGGSTVSAGSSIADAFAGSSWYVGAKGGIFPAGMEFGAFARGGIVKRPTLGLVGEGSRHEAVVPLPDNKRIPVDLRGAGASEVVNNINVKFTPDFAEMFKSSPDEIELVVNRSMAVNGGVRRTVRTRTR